MSHQAQLDAATNLEALVPVLKEMVIRLREGTEEQPYAAVYWLRREIGYIVATLGSQAPNTAQVESYYRAQMQD